MGHVLLGGQHDRVVALMLRSDGRGEHQRQRLAQQRSSSLSLPALAPTSAGCLARKGVTLPSQRLNLDPLTSPQLALLLVAEDDLSTAMNWTPGE
ncbi:hypothetical protein ACFFLM_23090 [Deinococcus oregonensis]|uniref:Uncharacterized protein n=1 Tax=Deinococcus oregonensis TaxID=1805970 RepID=A0ABV6B8V9_9DEIO